MSEKIKVLLIDDDEDEMVLTGDLLEEVNGRGYQLDWCETYPKALESIFTGDHDAYLIDYRLGSHTGLDILKQLKHRGLERATIMLTGQGDDEVDLAAMEMGAADYLIKGEFGTGDLDRAIRYAIERRKDKDALLRQAEILKNVHDAVFYVSESGYILEWNEGAVRIFELPMEEAIGASIFDVCPHDGAHPFSEKIMPKVKAKGSAEEVVRCQTRSGKEIIIRAKVTGMKLGSHSGFVVCASDVTVQKKLESEILRVSESEQRRIGQDIHDDLCSQLSGIGMMTKVLENQLKENHENESRMMAEISGMVADAGQKARRLAKGLVPAALDSQGLSRAIQELADQNKVLFGVDCGVTIIGPEAVDSITPAVGVQLYRIAQEATTNAMKHSDCESVEIHIAANGNMIEMEVSDDGKGISDDIFSNGLGMLTMRQRAEMINADFELHSFAGKGTRVKCSIQLSD